VGTLALFGAIGAGALGVHLAGQQAQLPGWLQDPLHKAFPSAYPAPVVAHRIPGAPGAPGTPGTPGISGRAPAGTGTSSTRTAPSIGTPRAPGTTTGGTPSAGTGTGAPTGPWTPAGIADPRNPDAAAGQYRLHNLGNPSPPTPPAPPASAPAPVDLGPYQAPGFAWIPDRTGAVYVIEFGLRDGIIGTGATTPELAAALAAQWFRQQQGEVVGFAEAIVDLEPYGAGGFYWDAGNAEVRTFNEGLLVGQAGSAEQAAQVAATWFQIQIAAAGLPPEQLPFAGY